MLDMMDEAVSLAGELIAEVLLKVVETGYVEVDASDPPRDDT